MATFTGFYGRSGRNTTEIYTYPQRNGGNWYASEGSTNINFTYDEIKEGTNIEELHDIDTLQVDLPIESEDDLINEVDN